MEYLMQTINELGSELINEKITKNRLVEKIEELQAEIEKLKESQNSTNDQ